MVKRTLLISAVVLFLVTTFLFLKNQNSKPQEDGGTISLNNMFENVSKRVAELDSQEELETAVLAGGCFWCMEGPFEQIEGVEEVIAGYTGGSKENPSYQQVMQGDTGHREAVKIYYDPQKVSFDELLKTYWVQIDPTDSGGQFSDRGPQYRTAIYYSNEQEKQVAENQKKVLDESGKYEKPIVVQILPEQPFYPAEDYHQNFYIDSAANYARYKRLSGREDFIENVNNAEK